MCHVNQASMLGVAENPRVMSKSCPTSRQSSGEHLAIDIGYGGVEDGGGRLSAASAKSYKRLSASSPASGSRQFLDPSYTPDAMDVDGQSSAHVARRLSDSAAIRKRRIQMEAAMGREYNDEVKSRISYVILQIFIVYTIDYYIDLHLLTFW
jgi:hypothetical protein